MTTFGSSHFYNCSANDNDGEKGLMRRKASDVARPTRIILATTLRSTSIFEYPVWRQPFQYMYWHDLKRLGFGNVMFVDTHVQYLEATLRDPDFQRGKNWSFIWND